MPQIQNRKFGVEIEAFDVERDVLFNALVHSGISVNTRLVVCENCCPCSECPCALGDCDCRCHRNAPPPPSRANSWKIVDDSSIEGDLSFELVSPILCGEQGLEQIHKVCKVLNKIKAKVAKDCGLHVHVDTRDLNGPTILNVKRRYGALEPTIDKFIAPSRRESRKYHCQGIGTTGPVDSLLQGNTVQSMIAAYAHDRYQKINLCAYEEHGSIEFRHHHGTTDGDKITNWIRFVVNFVEQSHISDESVQTQTEIIQETIPGGTVVLEGFTPRRGRGRRSAAEIQTGLLALLEVLVCHHRMGLSVSFSTIRRLFGWSSFLVKRKLEELKRVSGLDMVIYTNSFFVRSYIPTMQPFNSHYNEMVYFGQYKFVKTNTTNTTTERAIITKHLPPLPDNLDWKQGLDSEVVTYLKGRAQHFGFVVE